MPLTQAPGCHFATVHRLPRQARCLLHFQPCLSPAPAPGALAGLVVAAAPASVAHWTPMPCMGGYVALVCKVHVHPCIGDANKASAWAIRVSNDRPERNSTFAYLMSVKSQLARSAPSPVKWGTACRAVATWR